MIKTGGENFSGPFLGSPPPPPARTTPPLPPPPPPAFSSPLPQCLGLVIKIEEDGCRRNPGLCKARFNGPPVSFLLAGGGDKPSEPGRAWGSAGCTPRLGRGPPPPLGRAFQNARWRRQNGLGLPFPPSPPPF
ncbi:hypothetical protein HJG60_008824 [Phyllostomus discolor]|uniref:Uncharacterized protein n=1 Tax=Phyllostomus discolor TaxID=89673 RepID=A0A834DL57_9CHIR|nr:hypothetical protein HJG60_008824 [Phyllostomus discolor]